MLFAFISVLSEVASASLLKLGTLNGVYQWGLIIGAISLVGAKAIFWILGLRRISLASAISISSLAPVLLLVVAYFAFQEVVTLNNIIGGVFIVLGIICFGKASM